MPNSGLTLTGADALRRRLLAARASAPERMRAAMREALLFIELRAKQILVDEVYHKSEHDRLDDDSMFQAFFSDLAQTGNGVFRGMVGNRSPHAPFIELGTDDEGSGSHFVPVVKAGALHWLDPATGQSHFSHGHMVKGIHPIHFMQRALDENRPQVVAIFRRHFQGLFG
jgi:hypothetical protein